MADQQNPVAGWYADPSGDATKLRYWNGEQWTDDFTSVPYGANQGNGYGNPAYAQQANASSEFNNTAYAQPGYNYGNPTYAQPGNTMAYYPQTSANSTEKSLRIAAFIFCILSTLSVCWLIIPLAWMIPMTVHSWGIYKGTKPNTTAFGVCTLIFTSLIGGILLLVSKKDA